MKVELGTCPFLSTHGEAQHSLFSFTLSSPQDLRQNNKLLSLVVAEHIYMLTKVITSLMVDMIVLIPHVAVCRRK